MVAIKCTWSQTSLKDIHQVFRVTFTVKVFINYKQDPFNEYAKILFQIDQQQQTLFSTLSQNKLISIRRLNKQKCQKISPNFKTRKLPSVSELNPQQGLDSPRWKPDRTSPDTRKYLPTHLLLKIKRGHIWFITLWAKPVGR